jgi:hypothetical protein
MQVPFEELSEHIDCVKDLVTRDEYDLGLRGLAKVNVDIALPGLFPLPPTRPASAVPR